MSGRRKFRQCYAYLSLPIGLVGATLECGQSIEIWSIWTDKRSKRFCAASSVVDDGAGYFSALERSDRADYTVIMSMKGRHSNLNHAGKQNSKITYISIGGEKNKICFVLYGILTVNPIVFL